ncbi:MAG: GTPase Era [Nitrospirae bacterium]|nr:GTPase Era [Nitrospirota bacterium]
MKRDSVTKQVSAQQTTDKQSFRSGYICIVGKPNVGKSTLINTITGQKISIVTSRPQTTRRRIIGIKNRDDAQLIFFDTPGIHKPSNKLGELVVKTSLDSLKEADVVYLMVNPVMPSSDDLLALQEIMPLKKPVLLVINKIDTIKKENLLPIIQHYSTLYPFNSIIPVSAKNSDGLEELLDVTVSNLPEGPRYYPDDYVTDQIERDMVSELIREQVMKKTLNELPHVTAVEVTEWVKRNNDVILISANIYVEKDTQKGIIIGSKGTMLKSIGTEARRHIEDLLEKRVFLSLYVKVRRHWYKDLNALKDMGFC